MATVILSPGNVVLQLLPSVMTPSSLPSPHYRGCKLNMAQRPFYRRLVLQLTR